MITILICMIAFLGFCIVAGVIAARLPDKWIDKLARWAGMRNWRDADENHRYQ